MEHTIALNALVLPCPLLSRVVVPTRGRGLGAGAADGVQTSSELKRRRSQRSSQPAENKLRRGEALTMMVMIGFLMIPRINHKK